MGKSPMTGNLNVRKGRRGIIDDVDDILDEYSGSDEEENYQRHRGFSQKHGDEDDGRSVKVGRHVLPRFESLLASDDEDGLGSIDNLLSSETNNNSSDNINNSDKKRVVSKKKKSKKTSDESKMDSDDRHRHESYGGSSSKTEDVVIKTKVKRKKKKKKIKKPRPPSPEPTPMTGASANTVRMDSNFVDDDWDSD